LTEAGVVASLTNLAAIGMVTCNSITIANNVISSTGRNTISQGIDIEGSGTGPNTQVSITGNTFYRLGTIAIDVEGYTGALPAGNNVVITANTMYETGFGHASTVGQQAIYIGSGSHFLISGNVITSTMGSAIKSITLGAVSIIGNTIFNASKDQASYPINVQGNGLVVEGNFINMSTTSFGMILGTTTTGFVVSNNIFSNSKSGSDAMIIYGNDGTISDNTVSGTSGLPLRLKSAASDISVIGNSFDDGALSINNEGATGVTISSNILSGTIVTAAGAQPSQIVVNNQGFNPVAKSTYTACASVCTYTNNDGYDETFDLSAVNGISAWTCNGQTASILLGNVICTVPPGGTMVITWTVTAPTFNKVPLVA
jgi:hypothetical protein